MKPFDIVIFDSMEGQYVGDNWFSLGHPVNHISKIERLLDLAGETWYCSGSSSGPVINRGEFRAVLNVLYLSQLVRLEDYDGNPPAWSPERGLYSFDRGSIVSHPNFGNWVLTGCEGRVICPSPWESPADLLSLDWLFDIAPQHDRWCLACNESWAAGEADPEDCKASWKYGVLSNPGYNPDPPHYVVNRLSDGIWWRPRHVDPAAVDRRPNAVSSQLSLL